VGERGVRLHREAEEGRLHVPRPRGRATARPRSGRLRDGGLRRTVPRGHDERVHRHVVRAGRAHQVARARRSKAKGRSGGPSPYRGPVPATIRIGTCSWADEGLVREWYPRGVSSSEARLRHYAERFDVVEVDSPFYALPTPETAARWA